MKITKTIEDMRFKQKLSFIKIGEILNVHESTVRFSFNKKFGKEDSKITKGKGNVRIKNNVIGIKRNDIKIKHDPYLKITNLIDNFIKNMKKGYLYEESEVKKACRVNNSNVEYWESVINMKEYIQYQGVTEKNVILFGLKSELKWASSNDGITGFRKK